MNTRGRATSTALLMAMPFLAVAWNATNAPWPDLKRDILIDISGAPKLPGIGTETARTLEWWSLASNFQMQAIPSTGLSLCPALTDTVSMLVFQAHYCTDHIEPWVLGITISESSWTGDEDYRIDADVVINTGPTQDGFLLGLPWLTDHRNVHTAMTELSPSGTSWQSALGDAMAEWNGTDAFTLVDVDQYSDPCEAGSIDDQRTSIDFGQDVCGWTDFEPEVLAVTIVSFSSTGGTWRLIDADIVFNDEWGWDIYNGPLEPDRMDFRRVALHELGHVMGLEHSSIDEAIMFYSASDSHQLACDDRRGLRTLYGLNPDAACTMPDPRPPWHDWDLYYGPYRLARPDIRRVIAHEVGHLVGLDHSEFPDALMWWMASDTDRPLCDDQAGVQALYGPETKCIEVQNTIFENGFQPPVPE